MSRTFSVLTVVGITLVGGLVAYAAYFDYKRRNDVEFRKRLRKDKKRVNKTVAQSRESSDDPSAVTLDQLRAALDTVRHEEIPKTIEAKEQYFMAQVSLGEQLALQGPAFFLPAALSFYRALRVYPSPVELIVIYQKTVPEPIFKLVMEMTNLDVKDRIEGYYDAFPPKVMNVAVDNKIVTEHDGNQIKKKVLIATKDFAKGETIYTENPVVAVLDHDLQGKGTHCSYCLRHIQTGMAIRPPSDRLDSVFCSKECQVKAKNHYHGLLFSLESPLPAELSPPTLPKMTEQRDAAQVAFVNYLKDKVNSAPLLVAKFIGRQVAIETAKMTSVPTTTTPVDFPQPETGDYTLYDHIERLRYLELSAPQEEMKLLRDVLQTALPGLEQFVTEERHSTLLGKMSYNCYGVCFGGGRDDKPPSKERPENVEKTRTPYGTSRQIGCGFYLISSYISHSCAPSARPSFSSGTSELHLVATRALKKGDEITVAYVDVTQHESESVIDARRRRRTELARGWRFACGCQRCTEEGIDDANGAPQTDESKVDAAVSRLGDTLST